MLSVDDLFSMEDIERNLDFGDFGNYSSENMTFKFVNAMRSIKYSFVTE